MFPTDEQLNEFVNHYFEAALWAECDWSVDGEEFLDSVYTIYDFDPKSREKALQDAREFFSKISESARQEILEGNYRDREDCLPIALAGHDFWLTRRGHGAGFWDGDWVNGDEMTTVCREMGNLDIEADGKRVYLR